VLLWRLVGVGRRRDWWDLNGGFVNDRWGIIDKLLID
jgi:hypothetical protein